MKKLLCAIFALALLISALSGCNVATNNESDASVQATDAINTKEELTSEGTEAPKAERFAINGIEISEFTIVYSATALDYTERAAIYIRDQIELLTGITLEVLTDEAQATALEHEIVVGETNRAISASLDAETEGLSFALMADDNHVAMEGDYFVIAAAAFYFIDTYIDDEPFAAEIAKEISVCEPIVREAKNFIFLIGDGMGVNQTRLFESLSADDIGAYSDGEGAFYGYMLPYIGSSRTNSLSGTTDSAAGGTALSTGFKTLNGHVGKDQDLNDVKSLTEFAIELGKSTAVITTETKTGATPAAFSAHAKDRDDTADILACQQMLMTEHGTHILGGYGNQYSERIINKVVEKDLENTLNALSADEDGFFMMYEEAYIDKHSHSGELENTFRATLRFNQIIGRIMEFAFYNPNTFVIMTADHETGGLTLGEDGKFFYTTGEHTSADVPVFAYGAGAEVFDGANVENVQIPKTIAKLWGIDLAGYDNENYPSLIS